MTPSPSNNEGFRAQARLHELRVRWMLRTGACIAMAGSAAWVVLFALEKAWVAAAIDLMGVACGAATLALEWRGSLRVASWLMLVTLFLLVFLSAGFLDVPTVGSGRTSQFYFLPLAAASCLLLRRESRFLRHGFMAACLVCVAFFSGFDPRWESALAVSGTAQSQGALVDLGIALCALYIVLHVLQADIEDRHNLQGEIREGLLRGEMALHYQPQVRDDGLVVGAEALLRWHHPTRGPVFPAEFIPVAEATGLMPALGEWVLRAACEQLSRWDVHPQLRSLPIAVNVSATQFASPDFGQRVIEILAAHRVAPSRLKLELTESAVARDIDRVVQTMLLLRDRGILFSLDDFGTGFSSLSYLRRLPLSQLKIDQSFTQQMTRSAADLSIIKAVLTLARDLNLAVIAEGVETPAHRDTLRQLGCRAFQGYLFSKPLTATDFAAFVERSVVKSAARQPQADGPPAGGDGSQRRQVDGRAFPGRVRCTTAPSQPAPTVTP